ncbi:PREDICTED: pectinesterase QRT1-like [Camelina sativa]|uniref:pectinesterase n=1 Tax=Camelina sativa TaxID=90675 RepID=A0ABM0V2R2_CAMSA|nr:PREDICTED: pectinesterase QRT1-like [Camelina sativa]
MKLEAFIPAVVLLCFGVMLGLKSSCALQMGKESRNYISWADFRVVENGRLERRIFSVKEDKSNSVNTNANANAKNATSVERTIVVDKNGRGDSVTVQGAVDMVPKSNSQRVKIFILPGIYREKVRVPRSKPYISFIGNESCVEETVISWNDKASDLDSNGNELGTWRTASVFIESNFFCATAITFENTVVAEAGESGMQAVALQVSGDKAVFYKVRVLGSQDTLFDDNGSHFFYQSYIQGNVDFIFGNGKSLYQDCHIHSTAKTVGAIAAHHRDSPTEDTGFSFVNCDINGTGKVYLGRAWGNYSRTVYSNCFIADIITRVGWSDWQDPKRQRTAMFGEYNCRGRGAARGGRAPWTKTLTRAEVKPFLSREFIYGNQWLRL